MGHHDGPMTARKLHLVPHGFKELHQGIALVDGIAVGVVQINTRHLEARRLDGRALVGLQRQTGTVLQTKLVVAHGDEGTGNLQDRVVVLAESACFQINHDRQIAAESVRDFHGGTITEKLGEWAQKCDGYQC